MTTTETTPTIRPATSAEYRENLMATRNSLGRVIARCMVEGGTDPFLSDYVKRFKEVEEEILASPEW